MSELVKITVNDKEVMVPAGMGLVEAAAEAGVEIPIFCHHHKLDPVGVCRMCLVEVEGQRKPVTACTMRATEGMVVRTETPHIAHLRKGVLEFLLLNHPLDCPVCDKGGECPLQDNTFKYGPATSRLQVPKMQKRKAVDMGSFIVLDEERCILCRRCVRFDGEIALEGNLVVGERAHEAMITTTDGQPYDSYFSGNTIELCPVGALTSKNYRFRARPWDLSSAPSVCTGCSVGCNVELDFRFGELVRLQARPNEDVDGGWLCDRGRFNYRYIHADDRITKPLLRRGGDYVEVSWSEALLEIGNRLRTVQRERGKDSVGFIGGGRLTNEEAYAFQKLARAVVGTPHVDHRVSEQRVTSWRGRDGRIVDIDTADVIVNVDVLPQETMPVADLRIRRAAQRRGAKLFNVGPAATPYKVPHEDLFVGPGETAKTIRKVTEALAAGGEVGTEAGSGVHALTRALHDAKNVVVVWGGDDLETGAALADLFTTFESLATDGEEDGRRVRILIPGGQMNSRGAEAMGVTPWAGPAYEALAEGERGKDVDAMLEAAAAGELGALYLASANLLGTHPNRDLAQKALEKADFVVVQDLFLTETARLADVVLPAAEFPAKSGTYTNLEGRIQAVEQAMAERDESRTDLDVFKAVAGALGGALAASDQEFLWEVQHVLDKAAEEGFVHGAALPDVDVKDLVGAGDGRQEGADGFVLVPVDRLFAGGGTAAFDPGIRHFQPWAQAIFHPEDGAARGLKTGDKVELRSAAGARQFDVVLAEDVVRGTVQVPKGVVGAPVNGLTGGRVGVTVQVSKKVLEGVV